MRRMRHANAQTRHTHTHTLSRLPPSVIYIYSSVSLLSPDSTQQTFILLMGKLQNVIDESFFLADFVPLNLFMLDCRRLNKVIVNLINEIKHFVTDYFKALNQKENRRLVEQ